MKINNEDKMLSIIQYAYDNVVYYNYLFNRTGITEFKSIDNFFHLIPILEKDTVLRRRDDFISGEFNKSNLIHDRTSGSTGKILDIYWEAKDRIKSLLSLWSKRKIYYNITPDSRCCYFHSIAYRSLDDDDDKQIFSPRIIIRDHGKVMSLSKLDFSERMMGIFYERMCEFNPEWIMCHPSTLYIFAKFISRNNLKPFKSLRYIELTGEYLHESHREYIQSVFNVPTANEYGAREANGIAFECPEGNLHCLSQNVFVEIISQDQNIGYNKSGSICITVLNNRAMPFIRYNLGDKGKLLLGETCSCGDKNPVLVIEAGRNTDLITFDNGEYIDCVVFFYVIECINTEFNNCILQFQIIQKSKEHFTVKLVINENSDCLIEKIKQLFFDEIRKYGFGRSVWEFEFLNQLLPDYKSGKLNFFINENKS